MTKTKIARKLNEALATLESSNIPTKEKVVMRRNLFQRLDTVIEAFNDAVEAVESSQSTQH
jgi:hypothetical protein